MLAKPTYLEDIWDRTIAYELAGFTIIYVDTLIIAHQQASIIYCKGLLIHIWIIGAHVILHLPYFIHLSIALKA